MHEVKKWQIEYQYFYITQRPRVTVCYVRIPEHDGRAPFTAVGIAICSELDMPRKDAGKNIAFERSMNVLLHRGDAPIEGFAALPITSWRAMKIIDHSDMVFEWPIEMHQSHTFCKSFYAPIDFTFTRRNEPF